MQNSCKVFGRFLDINPICWNKVHWSLPSSGLNSQITKITVNFHPIVLTKYQSSIQRAVNRNFLLLLLSHLSLWKCSSFCCHPFHSTLHRFFNTIIWMSQGLILLFSLFQRMLCHLWIAKRTIEHIWKRRAILNYFLAFFAIFILLY